MIKYDLCCPQTFKEYYAPGTQYKLGPKSGNCCPPKPYCQKLPEESCKPCEIIDYDWYDCNDCTNERKRYFQEQGIRVYI